MASDINSNSQEIHDPDHKRLAKADKFPHLIV